MPAWIPALKAVLPIVEKIVTIAIPVFTSRRNQDKSVDLMVQEIAELQDTVKKNAESIKILAEQLDKTVRALEQGAASLEQDLKRARLLGLASLIIAAASVCLVLFVLVLR